MNLELIRFIREESSEDGRGIFPAAVLSGMANGMFVVIINAAAEDFSAANVRYLAMFVVCVALYVITKRYALFRTAVIVRSAVTAAHLRITDRIRKTDLLRFEGIGRAEIHGTLTENAEIIFEATRLLAASGSAFVMLVFSFFYIAWLSIAAFWMAVVLLAAGIGYFMLNQQRINEELVAVIQMESRFFTALDHLLSGFKEVKMHKGRNDDLFENGLRPVAEAARDMKIETEARFVGNHIFAQLFFYLLIAAIVFLIPRLTETSPEIIVSTTAVILFIVGPLGILVDAFPMLAKANVSVRKIRNLEALLSSDDDNPEDRPVRKPRPFGSLTMDHVMFRYPDTQSHGGNGFAVGPLDFSVTSGEMVFVVGGNGSGKTTLMKLLTGLYLPESGDILVDGVPVTPENRLRHRERFSMILTDFHLFDRLYGLQDPDYDRIETLLAKMQISHKVRIEDGRFSTLDLSTGQKKRLAIVVALLEDRDVLVFDEVAADQDPVFRKYYYEELLPSLKEEGRTVIAVSHDDRWYSLADRVVKMEYGRKVADIDGKDFV